MSTYNYYLFYGSEVDEYGKIKNPQIEQIDHVQILNKIQNIPYEYIDLVKSKDKIKYGTYRSMKTIFMHYKPGCPFTTKALDTIMKFDNNLIVRLWNIETGGPDRKRKIRDYIRNTLGTYGKSSSSDITFPQFFYKGTPIGGADTLAFRLDQITKNP